MNCCLGSSEASSHDNKRTGSMSRPTFLVSIDLRNARAFPFAADSVGEWRQFGCDTNRLHSESERTPTATELAQSQFEYNTATVHWP